MEFIVSLFCVILDLALCIHSYYLLNSKKIKLPLFYTIFPIVRLSFTVAYKSI